MRDATKKGGKKEADTQTADVEKGFSAQNSIYTSQRIRLTENQDMPLRVQMEGTKGGEGSEWVVKLTDRWGQRERGCYWQDRRREDTVGGGVTDIWDAKRKRKLLSRREYEQKQWVVGMTDMWGAKRKRKLFRKREERTQWVVGMTDI